MTNDVFFLVMINDMSCELPIYKYIDDCTVFEIIPQSTTSNLQEELDSIQQ